MTNNTGILFDTDFPVCTHSSNDRRASLWTDEEGQQWRTEWCHGCGEELAERPND